MNMPNPIQSCTGDLSEIPLSNESPVVVFKLVQTSASGICSHSLAKRPFIDGRLCIRKVLLIEGWGTEKERSELGKTGNLATCMNWAER